MHPDRPEGARYGFAPPYPDVGGHVLDVPVGVIDVPVEVVLPPGRWWQVWNDTAGPIQVALKGPSGLTGTIVQVPAGDVSPALVHPGGQWFVQLTSHLIGTLHVAVS